MRFALPRLTRPILQRIDGHRDLGAIHEALRQDDSGLTWERFEKQFTQLYVALNGVNHLLLSNPRQT